MSSEPFRFLHASQLKLDEPLTGTGPLESEARLAAEDATLTALENVVDACLAEGVEFLLLTGQTFGGSPTLRARRALLTAFENLCEFEIQVFWEAMREDLAGVDIPDNVMPIHAEDRDPAAVIRHGQVIATVAAGGRDGTIRPAGEEFDREERGVYRIGLSSHVEEPGRESGAYDYLALSATGRRSTRRTAAGLAHDPGPAQGTAVDEIGIHGATLVRVGADRATELTMAPTAPVRRERILVGVERDLTSGKLAERMQSALLELEPASVERLWIVDWQMIGNGGLFDALQSGAAVEELLETVNRRLATGNDIRRVDRLHFRRRMAQSGDELCEQISTWIQAEGEGTESGPVESVVRDLRNLTGPSWLKAINESLSCIDSARVRDDAARLSQELLLRSAGPGIGREQARQ